MLLIVKSIEGLHSIKVKWGGSFTVLDTGLHTVIELIRGFHTVKDKGLHTVKDGGGFLII